MAEQQINRGDLVVVYWYDIEDDPAWKSLAEVERERLPLCKSSGWFVNRDDSCVRLAFSLSGTEDTQLCAGRTLIPTQVVRNIELVREDELDTE